MEKEFNIYDLRLLTASESYDIDETLILPLIFNQEYDILWIINHSIFSKSVQKEWITFFIQTINSVSQYNYSQNDLSIFIGYIYYFVYGSKINGDTKNLDIYINELTDLVILDTNTPSAKWCQEELRLILLKILNLTDEIFNEHIKEIQVHLNTAKKMINKQQDYNAFLQNIK